MEWLSNIEKSAFRKGEYVGYGHGVWRIKRGGAGWRASSATIKPYSITAKTLRDLSPMLTKINEDHTDCACMKVPA